jgi:hypothetical protein
MKTVGRILIWLAVLAAGMLSLAGCSRYQIVELTDHARLGVTQFETLRITDYGMWSDVEHQFWLCRNIDDDLVCKRRCGGDSGIECPATTSWPRGITTNVR